jgi:hypothetical protein
METTEKKIEKEKKFELEFIKENDKKIIYQLMRLEEECLPLEMRNADSYNYYSGLLENPKNINIILKHKDKVVGFAVAREYEKVFSILANHDPDLRDKKEYLYIDVLQINPRFKLNGGLMLLISKLIERAIKKHAKGICIHVRKKNGLSQLIQRFLKGKKMHSIDNWLGFGEQFDYVEAMLNEKTDSRFIDNVKMAH